jgi:uncharacterized membrane protein (DUF106 family)
MMKGVVSEDRVQNERGRCLMIDDMEKLSERIKEQVKDYEERMASAMTEGNEGAVMRLNHEFQEVVGRDVSHFVEMAGEPMKSTLLMLLSILEQDPHASF